MRILFFIFILILLQTFVYFRFRRFLRTTKFYKPKYEYWALVPFLAFNIPFIVINIFWGRSFDPPEWFKLTALTPFHIWQGATFFIAVWLLIGVIIKQSLKLPVYILKIVKPLRDFLKKIYHKKPVQK